jgi:hypothetical protein
VVGVFTISDHVRLMRFTPAFRLGVVNGLGHWWRVGPGLAGTNVNQLTVPQSLPDLGGGLVGDCLVRGWLTVFRSPSRGTVSKVPRESSGWADDRFGPPHPRCLP